MNTKKFLILILFFLLSAFYYLLTNPGAVSALDCPYGHYRCGNPVDYGSAGHTCNAIYGNCQWVCDARCTTPPGGGGGGYPAPNYINTIKG